MYLLYATVIYGLKHVRRFADSSVSLRPVPALFYIPYRAGVLKVGDGAPWGAWRQSRGDATYFDLEFIWTQENV